MKIEPDIEGGIVSSAGIVPEAITPRVPDSSALGGGILIGSTHGQSPEGAEAAIRRVNRGTVVRIGRHKDISVPKL